LGSIGNLFGEIYNYLGNLAVGPLLTLHTWLATAGIESWGLTIIVFTLAIKIIFWPLTTQQIKASRAMQQMQPQLNELKKLYGKDKEKMMQEQMRLYKENSINPAAGCLPMLIQLPIWAGLYQGLRILAGPQYHQLTGGFLWIHSLANPEGFPYALAILTAASQFVVQRMLQTQSSDPQQQQMQQMMQFMPLMYLFFALSVPAGLVLYWVASNVFTMIQQGFYTGWGGLWPGGGLFGAAPAPAVSTGRPRGAPPAPTASPGANGTVNGATPSAAGAVANGTPRRPKRRKK
jgi:YidC/Oxa1 family membrane protein insertase